MKPMIAIRSAEFAGAAVRPEQYPPASLPEIAFAGRSNVGKSSLINCLLERRKLVRTSRTPGRTQTINFFRINNAFCFVDLPGYGYARVPTELRASWGPMVETYLTTRPCLQGVVQIIDLRHPPTAEDVQLWNWLRFNRIAALAVFTKADKVSRGQRRKHIHQAALALQLSSDDCVAFSATSAEGRGMLWEKLAKWLDSSPGADEPRIT
jgi:GTP-binding protein